MLLAVFSDSHGNSENMITAIARHKPDRVLFLGDGVRDAQAAAARFPEIPFSILCGNCDLGAFGCEDSALFEFGGVRIFAAHGHNHGVKYGMQSFATSVLCSGAQLGLYGHTHRPLCSEANGLWFLNPGSVGDYRSPTYGLIYAENGKFSCKILDEF